MCVVEICFCSCFQLRNRTRELEAEIAASHEVTIKAREASDLLQKMHAAAVKDVMAALADKRNAVRCCVIIAFFLF